MWSIRPARLRELATVKSQVRYRCRRPTPAHFSVWKSDSKCSRRRSTFGLVVRMRSR
jgi:hypothetical protein